MADGNTEQTRMIAEQVAEVAISTFVSRHPELRQASVVSEIPSPLKWAGGIVAALFTAGTATLAFWLVSSVSDMQVTLARMDERMASGMVKDSRVDDLTRRVTNNEANIARLLPQSRAR